MNFHLKKKTTQIEIQSLTTSRIIFLFSLKSIITFLSPITKILHENDVPYFVTTKSDNGM